MVVVAESVALVAARGHNRGDEVTCHGAIVVPSAVITFFVAAVCECFDLFECHSVGSFSACFVPVERMVIAYISIVNS